MAAQTGAGLNYASGGAAITVERFEGAGPGPRPAVILLHGAEGLTRGDVYRFGARAVAQAGYHAFMPHYLDRTGERRASFATMRNHFPKWVATLHDAVGFVGVQPGVDPERIGVIGFSLGGAVGLAGAAEDPRIKAFVNYFGFVPPGLAERTRRLPPTLILHGADDPIVSVSNAGALETLLVRLKVPHEVRIYPGQGHGLAGEPAWDAASRAVGFLSRHLGGSAALPALEGLH